MFISQKACKMHAHENQDLRSTISKKLNEFQSKQTKIVARRRHTAAANIQRKIAKGRISAGAAAGRSLLRASTTCRLHFVVDTAMVLGQTIIHVGKQINRGTRIQLLFLFFQDALAIVFNTYSVTMLAMQLLLRIQKKMHVNVAMVLLFYGHRILGAALELLLTIAGFAHVYNSINDAALVVNELNLYVTDKALHIRLSQFAAHISTNLRPFSLFGLFYLDGSFIYAIVAGTTTYIIILAQYEGQDELGDGPAGYNETGSDLIG